MTNALMGSLGYRTMTYTNPQKALDEFEPAMAAVLVTDILMPEMRGIDMALTMQRRDPTLPVVFISGYSPDEIPLGDTRVFLPKPFTTRQMEEVLAKLPARARHE